MVRVSARTLLKRSPPLFFLATVVTVVFCWYGVNLSTVKPIPSQRKTPIVDVLPRDVSFNSHAKNLEYADPTTLTKKEVTAGVKEESFLEKVRYQFIKRIMQSLLTSHQRRHNKITHMKSYHRGRDRRGKLLTEDKNFLSNHSAELASEESENIQTAIATQSIRTRPKKILFYGGFYGSKKLWKKALGERTKLRDCPERKCVFTTRDSEANTADVLIFNYIDFHLSWVPKSLLPHQRYVWLNQESPERSTHIKQGRGWHTSWGTAGVFNWTMTYHRSSDIYMPFGSLISLMGKTGGQPFRVC